MLKYACENWQEKPEYVVLMGDDSVNVTGFDTSTSGPQSVGLMPTLIYEADTTKRVEQKQDTLLEYTDAIYYTVTDTTDSIPFKKGRHDYWDYPSVRDFPFALGRIPAHTAAECSTYIEKVKGYETANNYVWYNNVILTADDAYQGELLDQVHPRHIKSTELLAVEGFRGFFIDKIYLSMFERSPTLRHDNAREAFFSTVNQGARWIVYFGHGHPDTLSDEGYLRTGDASLFSNGTAMPGFFSFSCSNGDFIRRDERQMCKTFLFAPNDGCIFYFGGSVETYANSNEQLARSLFTLCDTPDYRSIGKAVLYAHLLNHSSSAAEAYHLLGDPAIAFIRKKLSLTTTVAGITDGSAAVQIDMGQVSDLPVNYSCHIATGDSVSCLDDTSTRWWSEEVTGSFSGNTATSFTIEIPASDMKNNPHFTLYAWNATGEYRFDTTFITSTASSPLITFSTQNRLSFHLRQRNLHVLIPDTAPRTSVSLKLFSLNGKLIRQSAIPTHGRIKTAVFSLHDVASGTYAIAITFGSSRTSGKICIPY